MYAFCDFFCHPSVRGPAQDTAGPGRTDRARHSLTREHAQLTGMVAKKDRPGPDSPLAGRRFWGLLGPFLSE